MAQQAAQHRGGGRSRWWRGFPLALLALLHWLAALGGCVAAGGADAGIDAPVPPTPLCTSPTICDHDSVRACLHGMPGTVLYPCDRGQTCSFGRCTSLSCAMAERNDTLNGCLFYGALADNIDRDDKQGSTVIVVNQDSGSATVSLQIRDDGVTWRDYRTLQVPGAGADRFAVPSLLHMEGGGIGPRMAFRVVSDRPLSATLFESDDATEMSESSASTMLLPANTLGDEYMVMTYPQQTTAPLSATPGSHDGAGQVVVVATVDQTRVTVRMSATGYLDGRGGLPPSEPGQSFTEVLNDGDIMQLQSRGEGSDLTGTLITADRPIAVLSGNVFTAYGRQAAGINSPDLALEQMLPIRSWSQSYVAARLTPQKDTCDSLFGGNSALWRLLAARDDTRVTFEAPPGKGGDLPNGELILNAGDVREILVSNTDSFLMKANQVFLATQGMDCEATLSAGIATDWLLRDFRFALPANFDHELVVVRREGTPVILNQVVVGDAKFEPAGGPFEVAHLPLTTCVGHPRECTHQLQGTFGVTVRGMDVVCAYAFTPQTWPPCVRLAMPNCIP